MQRTANLLADIPAPSETEKFTDILNLPGIRIERIVSTGQADPMGQWQCQGWDEWVLLVEGRATVEMRDANASTRQLPLERGDYLLISTGTPHRVASTDPDHPTIWLAVHIGETR
jgi:cupin 2 domain-containing protein